LREQNSRLFVSYSGQYTLDHYVDLQSAKNTHKPIEIFSPGPQEGFGLDNPNEKSRETYILSATANSDLIVVAEPLERQSGPTEGSRFIFSDYTVVVDRVLLARRVTVLPGQSIVVTRAGGILQYRGRTLIGSVPGFELFHLNEPYMMFLRLLPNGTFFIFAEAAYNLQDQQVDIHPIHRETKNETKKLVPRDQFMEDVDRAIKRREDRTRRWCHRTHSARSYPRCLTNSGGRCIDGCRSRQLLPTGLSAFPASVGSIRYSAI
jgi:hypothetical protein